MRLHLPLVAVLALPCLAFPAAASDQLSGFVTALDPPSAIQLNGRSIQLTPTTQLCIRTHTGSAYSDQCPSAPVSSSASFLIGQELIVFGKLDRSSSALTASKIVLNAPSPASVSGTAIIDLVPSAQSAGAKQRIIRADGYLLHITADTKLNLAPPLKSLADISTNQWIQYSGVQQTNGIVELNYAGVGPNNVSSAEDSLRKKTEYDPSAVPDDAHQSGLSKVFVGTDPKRIPPWHDAAMQARVERIGNSLIPAYQRALPDDDPAKIKFRFQVIDAGKARGSPLELAGYTNAKDATYLTSGVIVVPYQIVDRMQTDDQLATVLADNIAENLEKDTVRMVPLRHTLLAANIAGDVAGFFVPGVSTATGLATGQVASHVEGLQLQQSGRVSLCLLHDAGYNIDQAPIAWWLLAAKSGQPLSQAGVPPRAITLYIMLNTTWHTSAKISPSAFPSAASIP